MICDTLDQLHLYKGFHKNLDTAIEFLAAHPLETLPLEEYQKMTPLFTEDVYDAISLETCVRGRVSQGGPSPKAVAEQLKLVKAKLELA